VGWWIVGSRCRWDELPHDAQLPLVALALTALATPVTLWQFHSRPPGRAAWDEARLAAELEALGYHCHLEPADREGALLPSGHPRAVLAGVYACREEPADWEQVASRQRGDPKAWQGCVFATTGGHLAPEDRNYLAAGPWILSGDPDELARIARALGLPR
jgi:hypothetical protein